MCLHLTELSSVEQLLRIQVMLHKASRVCLHMKALPSVEQLLRVLLCEGQGKQGSACLQLLLAASVAGDRMNVCSIVHLTVNKN